MNKQILKLATPNIISNITVPLLGMVDLAIMGHLDSEKYLGAISLGGMVFNFIYLSFNFLRMGTGGLTAQSYGRNDHVELISLLLRGLLIALLSGLFLMISQVPIAKLGFYVIEGSKEVEDLAAEYFYIRIYAAPATIGLFALTGWFIGMQDAKTPMIIAVFINVMNVILNLMFIYGMDMKSDGVAWGTLISQYLGFGLGLFYIYRNHKGLFQYFSIRSILHKKSLKEFFQVNRDIFIRTVVLISVFSFFTAESAKINDKILAVNTMLLQYVLLFSFIMDGFAHAAEALSGKYFGMNNKALLKKTVLYIFAWGAVFSITFFIIYVFFGKSMLHVFTNNKEIIDMAVPYLLWISIVPLISFASYLWDGIYIGVTASKAMRNTMLMSAFFVFLPTYLLLNSEFGNNALWASLVLFLFARGVFQSIYAQRAVFGQIK